MADENKLPLADLPGDLPEDWKLNDAISPNGTDTGKTKQHGYNYLMNMVNSVHKKVNGIISYITGLHKISFSGQYKDLENIPLEFPPESHTHIELHTHSNKAVLDKIDQGMLDTILYFTDSEVTE